MTEEDYLKHGFFPEIIRVTQGRFPLVYVDSHLYPANDTEKLKNSRKILGKFLSENNVTYIDLNQREELNNTELYAIWHISIKKILFTERDFKCKCIEINFSYHRTWASWTKGNSVSEIVSQ